MNQDATADKALFGFWVYLMTDLIVFAVLFATYAVMRNSAFGGPGGDALFRLRDVFVETLILLTSSFTCGLAMHAVRRSDRRLASAWLAATAILGLAFIGLELREFSALIASGNGPGRSAFLSAFFTLVGTHGLHIAAGLLWMAVSLFQIRLRGLSPAVVSRLSRLALFWHFLDLIWIFIFSFVYLTGIAL